MAAGIITKPTQAVRVNRTPSFICLEYRMLLKILYSSLSNDIAPVTPKRSLKKNARRDAR